MPAMRERAACGAEHSKRIGTRLAKKAQAGMAARASLKSWRQGPRSRLPAPGPTLKA